MTGAKMPVTLPSHSTIPRKFYLCSSDVMPDSPAPYVPHWRTIFTPVPWWELSELPIKTGQRAGVAERPCACANRVVRQFPHA